MAKNLNILSWNANSVRNHRLELVNLLTENDIDVACIQETFLKPSIPFNLPGYRIIRKDRLRTKGGGVLIAMKSSICFNVIEIDLPDDS